MTRWSSERAFRWYDQLPWVVGCNFIPSTAVNQLEMWQAATFDLPTIDRELGWAASLGFNTVRVYLHDLLWEDDAPGLLARLDAYLDVAAGHGIRTLLVLFDDCWNEQFALGPQPDPRPGVHNSGWVQSPGAALVADETAWPRLERYVTGMISALAADERVLLWDLYNEPGGKGLRETSLPLLRQVFEWARGVNPGQPLTVGIWAAGLSALNAFQLAASDVITFHHYDDAASLRRTIADLKAHGRPLICTEYMARTRGCTFETHLPVFKQERIGAINWGLVSGKTNTIFAWETPLDVPEPEVWFHDIFRADGTPYDAAEVALIRDLTEIS